MSTAGYSGTPLQKKLGIKAGDDVAILRAPDEFIEGRLGKLPHGVQVGERVDGPHDVIVFFTTERNAFERRLGALRRAMQEDGSLWIAWPKKASNVKTDMTEGVIRDIAIPTGLVDNKVCAIDDTWSGLRLVIRKELRGQ